MTIKSFDQIWELICEQFKNDPRYNSFAYDLWISIIRPLDLAGDQAVVEVDTHFQKSLIEKNYKTTLEQYLADVLGFEVSLEILCSEEQEKKEKPVSAAAPVTHFGNTPEEYTFDTFVVGEGNRFAFAACQAVANDATCSYNPLFIYGKSGLGKTHLLFGILNKIKETRPGSVILYVKCEQFTNEFINAIQEDSLNEFKNKYRKVDVLLMDDIQFLANKERVQEEFFHTFNDLYHYGKQIVLTSDRPPKEIPTLQDRIKTRFESGLITDIQIPDFETRVAIIRRKAESENLEMGADVVEMLANKLKSNIRQIEGVVTKLAALKNLEGKKPSLSVVQLIINEIVMQNKPTETVIDRIMQEVSSTFSVSVEDIRSRRKTADLALSRHVCFYLIKEMTSLTMKEIGNYFGGKDPTTVLYGCERISEKMEEDRSFADIIEGIKKNVSNE